MSTSTHLANHLQDKFSNYSIHELITLNNDLVENGVWGSSRSTFRNAVLQALAKKGVNLSPIICKADGFSIIQIVKIELIENEVVPINT